MSIVVIDGRPDLVREKCLNGMIVLECPLDRKRAEAILVAALSIANEAGQKDEVQIDRREIVRSMIEEAERYANRWLLPVDPRDDGHWKTLEQLRRAASLALKVARGDMKFSETVDLERELERTARLLSRTDRRKEDA